MNKVKTKNSKEFSCQNRKCKRFFRPKTSDLQNKKRLHRNCKGFSGQNRKCKRFFRPKTGVSPPSKKKVFLSKTSRNAMSVHKSTDLGLHLHSSSPEPVYFFGEQSSLWGAQFSFREAHAVIWGARPRYAHPRCAGSAFMQTLPIEIQPMINIMRV